MAQAAKRGTDLTEAQAKPIGDSQTAILDHIRDTSLPQIEQLIGQVANSTDDSSVNKLSQLLDLKNKEINRLGELKYTHALGMFQSKCPTIPHDKDAGVFTYPTRARIIEIIQPYLTKWGFALTFTFKRYEIPEHPTFTDKMKCIMTIRHAGGHSERAELEQMVPKQMKSGRNELNPAQISGAISSYLDRTILVKGLGLTTTAADIIDEQGTVIGMGQSSGHNPYKVKQVTAEGSEASTLTEEQMDGVRERLDKEGIAEDELNEMVKTLTKGKIEEWRDIPSKACDDLLERLNKVGEIRGLIEGAELSEADVNAMIKEKTKGKVGNWTCINKKDWDNLKKDIENMVTGE